MKREENQREPERKREEIQRVRQSDRERFSES